MKHPFSQELKVLDIYLQHLQCTSATIHDSQVPQMHWEKHIWLAPHKHTHTHTHTCMHTCTHTCAHTHMYAHTHAHAPITAIKVDFECYCKGRCWLRKSDVFWKCVLECWSNVSEHLLCNLCWQVECTVYGCLQRLKSHRGQLRV